MLERADVHVDRAHNNERRAEGLVGFDDTPLDTRGSDIIGRIALVVEGGTMTINTYAGFYS